MASFDIENDYSTLLNYHSECTRKYKTTIIKDLLKYETHL